MSLTKLVTKRVHVTEQVSEHVTEQVTKHVDEVILYINKILETSSFISTLTP